MARPVRYEAAGAVYHVMARGDGGRDVFVEDEDRKAWLEALGKTCVRLGWRVHAFVLMGNHFHLLLETPEPNLISGMKWLMGVFSQGWNRRRLRRGHVFQGRYKAVVVNGEEKEAHYLRVVADYIHLNPVRSAWVGGDTGRKLKEYAWSSFSHYHGRKAPDWLEMGRVIRAFELAEGKAGRQAYARYLEARAMSREATMNDASLKELRRGWYLGEKGFAEKLLREMGEVIAPKRRKGSVRGEAARAHDEAEAERLVSLSLRHLKMPESTQELRGRGRWRDEKTVIAALVKERTVVKNAWVADRLAMGHEGNVTQALRRVRQDAQLQKAFMKLRRTLEIRD